MGFMPASGGVRSRAELEIAALTQGISRIQPAKRWVRQPQ